MELAQLLHVGIDLPGAPKIDPSAAHYCIGASRKREHHQRGACDGVALHPASASVRGCEPARQRVGGGPRFGMKRRAARRDRRRRRRDHAGLPYRRPEPIVMFGRFADRNEHRPAFELDAMRPPDDRAAGRARCDRRPRSARRNRPRETSAAKSRSPRRPCAASRSGRPPIAVRSRGLATLRRARFRTRCAARARPAYLRRTCASRPSATGSPRRSPCRAGWDGRNKATDR